MKSFKWNTELDSIPVDHQEDAISTVFFYWTKKMDFPILQIWSKHKANATFAYICSYLPRSKHYICLTFAFMTMLVKATFSSHLLPCVKLE